MQALIDEFGVPPPWRGQSEHTQKPTASSTGLPTGPGQAIESWNEVTLTHLLAPAASAKGLQTEPEDGRKTKCPRSESAKLSTASLYLEIAALKAFFRFVQEEFLRTNHAENLSLPRRWKRLPKALTLGD